MGLDRLLPLPKPQVQRRIIFSASLRKGEDNATDVSELSRQSPALKSVYTDRKAVLSLHTYICIKIFCCIFTLCFCSVAKREHKQLQIQFHKNANFSNSKYFEFYSFSSGLFWSPSLSHPMFRKQPEPQKSG